MDVTKEQLQARIDKWFKDPSTKPKLQSMYQFSEANTYYKQLSQLTKMVSFFNGDVEELRDKMLELIEHSVGREEIEALSREFDSLAEMVESMTGNVIQLTGEVDEVGRQLLGKQEKLVSGENIKTINHINILGHGNIDIEGGGGGTTTPQWGSIGGDVGDQTDLMDILDNKMSYYRCTFNNNHFISPDGQIMNYADIKAKFDDPSAFIYLVYQNLVYIPSIDVPNSAVNAIAFSVDWTRSESLGLDDEEYDRPYISRVIINSNEQIRTVQVSIETTDLKEQSFEYYEEYPDATRELLYPSIKAVWNFVKGLLTGKQDTLVSGTSIKTINNSSLLGSGNVSLATPLDLINAMTNKQNTLVSGSNIKTIRGISLLGSEDITSVATTTDVTNATKLNTQTDIMFSIPVESLEPIDPPDWDTYGEYHYKAFISVPNVTANSMIENFVLSTITLDKIAPVVETAEHGIYFFLKSSIVIAGSIYQIVTREVA